MERKEIYAKIKELNLQNKVKNVYGKNFTQVGSSDLEKLIQNHNSSTGNFTTSMPDDDVRRAEEVNNSNVEEPVTIQDTYEAACLVFLGLLKDSGKLDTLLSKL